jgi:predicted metal-dependent hydrolase
VLEQAAAAVQCDDPGAAGPPGYRAFFACFNAGRFLESHEVLEADWLPRRRGPDGDFYKGLIQLGAAFVHLERGRPGPAATLLCLARSHLAKYPERHHGFDRLAAERLIARWLAWMDGVAPRPEQPVLPVPSGLDDAA